MSGIPILQVRGSSVLIYDEPVRTYSGAPSYRRQLNMRLQQKKVYAGGMTTGTRKRMAKAITIMCQAIRPKWVYNAVSQKYQFHRFSFVTLTVASPRNITARQAYDWLLAPFLDWMRKTKGVRTYIWKAELQKRGQIHYHITTPAWIHLMEIRNKWNQLQHAAGLLDEYATEHGHFNPNSTDIHNVHSVRKMDNYLVKELAKSLSAIQVEAINDVNNMVARGELEPSLAEEKVKEIEAERITTVGKIWDCSNDLAGVGYYSTALTSRHEQMIAQWVAEGKAFEKADDFYCLVVINDHDPPDLLSGSERNAFHTYLQKVMTRNDRETDIPAACVDDQLDREVCYTWNEIEVSLN